MSEAQTEIKTVEAAEEIVVSTELKNIIEALIFACDEPMTVRFIRSIVDEVNKDLPPAEHITVNAEIVRKAVGDLNRGYGRLGSGFRIIEIAGGFTFATQEQFSSWVGKLAKEKARRRLSPTAVETLAIIAYKQPIAKGEVEFIRGVNVDYIINALLEKDLIHITGRANTPGRPLLYGTTQKFLEHFGLNELTDLPKPREISELINETELEVDRRLLAEQQELEFKEDLEKKLEGNEGTKNKPQKNVRMKAPDALKSEKSNTSADQQAAVPEHTNVEKGEISSESNSAADKTTAAEAAPLNEAATLENAPEIQGASARIPSPTEEPESRQEPEQENPATLSEAAEVLPTENVQERRMIDAQDQATNAGQGRRTIGAQDLATNAGQDQATIAVRDQATSAAPEEQMTVSGNSGNDLEHQNVLHRESVRTDSMDAGAEHSVNSTASGFPESTPQSKAPEEPSTGWSKWKNKVKTFFQKLFA